jgi:hypothetical protein
MGHKLAVDELELSETTIPLADLSGIQIGDALRIPWPRADAIIGNPPFHGSQQLRKWLGDDYVEWLKSEFGIGVKDYCVYWFRKAHDRLEDGKRAGLVGTNSISQNRARGVSLDYIVENDGVITSAVSKQAWPGEAVVNVSIVNWAKSPISDQRKFFLDGEEVQAIAATLRPEQRRPRVAELSANHDRSFQGVTPSGSGFVLSENEAEELLQQTDDIGTDVIRPYLDGSDIADDPEQRPRRFVVDFGTRSLEQAMQFPAALAIVEARVRPGRTRHRNQAQRKRWWLFERPRAEMREALILLRRYVVCNRYGKRLLFAWAYPSILPSGQVVAFAFDDDYAFGILTSRVHAVWAWAQSSTLRVDIRYTPTSAFETFPWPDPITDTQREEIAELARKIVARRQEICLERQIGLTSLYNEVDDGAYADLAILHRKLDEAVCVAYGWPRSIAGNPDETNARLLALNQEIAAGKRLYDPFRTNAAEEIG